MDETKLTGMLPNLMIEIVHRVSDDSSAEHLSVNLTALPDFRAALSGLGRFTLPPMAFPSAFLLAPPTDRDDAALPLGLDFWLTPWRLWGQTVQAVFQPWLGMAHGTAPEKMTEMGNVIPLKTPRPTH